MRKGFTFIEVLISLALVSFLGAGLAGMMIQSLAAKARADGKSAMTALAVEKLEILRSLPPDDDALREGRREEIVSSGTSPLRFRRTWTVEDADGGMKRVEITVAPEGISAKTFRAVLYLSPELGFRP